MSKVDSRTWTVAEAGAALAKSGAESVTPFSQGTLEIGIYRPAGVPHRFEDFSLEFATWVFFYGPEGGE